MCLVGVFADFTVVNEANARRSLVDAISEPFDLEGRHVYLGVSIGLAVCPNDGRSVDVLLKNADMAMYRAKSEGRSTYRFFEPEWTRACRNGARWKSICAMGIFERRVSSFTTSRKSNAKTDEITGCEALLRWNQPVAG